MYLCDLRKVCKNYKAVSDFIMRNLLIAQETRQNTELFFFQKKLKKNFEIFLHIPQLFVTVKYFCCLELSVSFQT